MKNWQKRIDSAKKFIGRNNEFLYDAVKELVAAFDDPEFSADIVADGGNPMEYLNAIVSGTCANFTELYQMFKKFPNKEQWAEGNIGEMRLQMIRDIRDVRRTNGNGHKRSEEAATEDDAKESKRKRNEEEVLSWKERCLKGEETVRELKATVRELKAENRQLKTEVADLKDILKGTRKRQPAGV